jgi:hypothetical protein
MQYEYIITLKRPGYFLINTISVILLVLFLAAFGFFVMSSGWSGRQYWLLLVPAMIIGLMIYGYVRSKEKDFLVYYRTELFIAALGWFLFPEFTELRYLGWLYALMAFIERLAKRPDQWGFAKEAVDRLGIPKKSFNWVDIENVVIRDNLITIDFRNNKILQKELDSPVDKPLEREFNDFCQQQLHFIDTVDEV